MECVAHPMLYTGEVTVKLAAPISLPNLVEQLCIVLAGPHASVTPGVDMRHVQNWYGSVDVIADLKDLFYRPPKLLAARGLDPYQRRLHLLYPREGSVGVLILIAPDTPNSVDYSCEYICNLFVCFGSRLILAIGPYVVN